MSGSEAAAVCRLGRLFVRVRCAISCAVERKLMNTCSDGVYKYIQHGPCTDLMLIESTSKWGREAPWQIGCRRCLLRARTRVCVRAWNIWIKRVSLLAINEQKHLRLAMAARGGSVHATSMIAAHAHASSNELLDSGWCRMEHVQKTAQVRSQPINQTSKFILSRLGDGWQMGLI